MKELWVPAEQDVIVRLHSNGDVNVTQDVAMVKRPVSGTEMGFSAPKTSPEFVTAMRTAADEFKRQNGRPPW